MSDSFQQTVYRTILFSQGRREKVIGYRLIVIVSCSLSKVDGLLPTLALRQLERSVKLVLFTLLGDVFKFEF